MPGEERNEAPTPRRREEARNRGQVPKSTEVISAAGILAAFALLKWSAPAAFGELKQYMVETYRHLPTTDLTPEQVGPLALGVASVIAKVVGPIALGLLVCGVVVNVVQTGFLFSMHPLKPELSKLNPLKGLARMVSARTWFDLFKTAAKVFVCGLALYQVALERQNELMMLGGVPPAAALGTVASIAFDMGLRVAELLVVAAVVDYAYQRFQFEKNIRMSRQEVKEEMRNAEGDPQTRQRLRSQMRNWSQRRMMQAVPQADVLVTNPTHLAIALKYDPKAMGAPRVVAKGEALMAERIIAVAKEHRVPIVRNIPLAHALYRSVEIGGEIPATLYRAVAEVLAFVYRLRAEQRAAAV